jgi:lipopolysaccharide export LptBFGC system permease protein LptF
MTWGSSAKMSILSLFRARRRIGGILSSYVIQEVATPTILALAGLTILLLTKDLLSFSDFVINRGFGVSVVALISLYEMVPLAARTLPFAVLIGTLVGLSRLRADREILALEATGISSRRLVGPVLTFAAVMMSVGLLLSLFVAPWATQSLVTTLRHMASQNPGLSLRAGTVREFNGAWRSTAWYPPLGSGTGTNPFCRTR